MIWNNIIYDRCIEATQNKWKVESDIEAGLRFVTFYIKNENKSCLASSMIGSICSLTTEFNEKTDINTYQFKDMLYMSTISPSYICEIINELVHKYNVIIPQEFVRLERLAKKASQGCWYLSILYNHLMIQSEDEDTRPDTIILTKNDFLKNKEKWDKYIEITWFNEEYNDNKLIINIKELYNLEYLEYANPKRIKKLLNMCKEYT